MKYMKLGCKNDSFIKNGNITTVAAELPSDVVFIIDGMKYHLHKYPLLSKCGYLQKLVTEVQKSSDELKVGDIPGGADAFELCAKFCYGITITVNAVNIMAVYCASQYLQMTETMEKGNLFFKVEAFLNSTIFQSWKDLIISLQTTATLLPWAEDLKLVNRCVESVASKTSVDPSSVDWAFTHKHVLVQEGTSPPWNGIHSHKFHMVPDDWFVKDICGLDIHLYWKVMLAIKARGRVKVQLIGEALRVYAYTWLPGLSKDQHVVHNMCRSGTEDFVQSAAKHRFLLESIVSLLPSERGASSCTFLLKLLKAATILSSSASSKLELARRIGLQLEEAPLKDLLIPSLSYTNESLYDVELVYCILEHFLMQDPSPALSSGNTALECMVLEPYEQQRTLSAEDLEYIESRGDPIVHSSKIRVAKLIDGYLAEIARDTNLTLSKFIGLAEFIPETARPVHDDLYRAIDVYLMAHPGLTKTEKKKICRLMNCKRLSLDACMHAAQNERLPLRVVVQVLFFEQMRTAMAGRFLMNDIPSNLRSLLSPSKEASEDIEHLRPHSSATTITREDRWAVLQNVFRVLKSDLHVIKKRTLEAEKQKSMMQQQVVKHSKLLHLVFQPKKIFSKLRSSVRFSLIRRSDSVSERSARELIFRRSRHSVL